MRLPDPPLLVISDRRQSLRDLSETIGIACAAGCRWISLREKDLSETDQVRLAREFKVIARRWGARVTLHGSPGLAHAAGVDGVHLPAGSDSASARRLLGRRLIGISIHDPLDAKNLIDVDYAVAGPVFETASKPGYGPPLGMEGLTAIAATTSVPIIAIGGITAERVPALLRSGAKGVAVMGAVMRAASPAPVVRDLVDALDPNGASVVAHRSPHEC